VSPFAGSWRRSLVGASCIPGYIDNELESDDMRIVEGASMQIKDVSAFVKAAEAGNLHAAAAVIGITQPALTKSIRRLETALEVRLFERTARGVALTPIGKVLYERSRALELLVNDIRTEVADIKTSGSGLVRIGAVPAVVESIVAPMLSRFVDGEGALRFDIQVQLSGGLLRNLQAGQLDLAVAAIPSTLPADLGVKPLAALRSAVVAREGHAMLGRRFTLAELARQKWLLPPSDILLSQWVNEMFIDEGLVPPEVAVQADASPAIFAALVRSTDLLTVMTHAMLHSSMGIGLAPLPAPAQSWEIQLGLFWRRKGFFSSAMAQCRDQLEAAFTGAAGSGARRGGRRRQAGPSGN